MQESWWRTFKCLMKIWATDRNIQIIIMVGVMFLVASNLWDLIH